jgi:hypothetical protein
MAIEGTQTADDAEEELGLAARVGWSLRAAGRVGCLPPPGSERLEYA